MSYRVFAIIYMSIMAICFGLDVDSRYLDYMYFVAEYSLLLFLLSKLKNNVPIMFKRIVGAFCFSMIAYNTIEYFIFYGQPRVFVFAYFCFFMLLTWRACRWE